MEKQKYYKVLKADGSCCNGGQGVWSLPTKNDDGTWTPGAWMPKVKGKLMPCERGYHICRRQDLIYWLEEAIFEVEYRGVIVEDDQKCVVREARLLRKIETWDEKTVRLFAADCAEKVLPIYESEYPDDDRPRKAIQAARDYANGKIKKAARSAAWSAALSAVESAALSAAESAAWSAALSAAESASWSAARSAALSAAESASWSAAESAARSAAESVARSAAREWQTDQLFKYLEER